MCELETGDGKSDIFFVGGAVLVLKPRVWVRFNAGPGVDIDNMGSNFVEVSSGSACLA